MTLKKYLVKYQFYVGNELVCNISYLDKKTYNKLSSHLYAAFLLDKIYLLGYDFLFDYYLSKNNVTIIIERS